MINEMVRAFDYTVGFVERSVSDLSDEEMGIQPYGVPNHAAWTLGHIIFSCQGMATELGAEPWLPEDWESVFGYGSTPGSGSPEYPPKEELLSLLADATARLSEEIRRAERAIGQT